MNNRLAITLQAKFSEFLEEPTTEKLIPLVNLLFLYSYTEQGKSLDEIVTEASERIFREIELR